jgi:hypothetical protein
MAIKQISGGAFQYPDGSKVAAGTLVLRLSQDATVSGTGQVAPAEITITLDSNGNANEYLWFNDSLSPSGTVYQATLFDASGRRVWGPENWSLAGSSPLDISTLVPASSSVSFSGAILIDPAGNQEIETGTLTVNDGIITQALNNVAFANAFSGSDAAAKISAAITSLGSSGGVVDARGLTGSQTLSTNPFPSANPTAPIQILLGNGTYTCTAAWNQIARSNLRITGQGAGLTLVHFAPASVTDDFIVLASKSNIIIEGISFTGTANSCRVLQSNACTSVYVRDCVISGFTGTPAVSQPTQLFFHHACSDIRIENNVITGNGAGPNNDSNSANIAFGTSADGITNFRVRGNSISGNFVLNSIVCWDGLEGEISGNYVNQNNQIKSTDLTLGGYGILLYQTTLNTGEIRRVQVVNNRIKNTAGTGIYVANNGDVSDIIISGNTIENIVQRETGGSLPKGGIALNNGGKNFSIVGNVIDTSGFDGIVIQESATNVTVAGNAIRNIGSIGIHITQNSGSCTAVTITGNTIDNCSTNWSILQDGTLNQSVISNNVITAPGFTPLGITLANDLTISGNSFKGLSSERCVFIIDGSRIKFIGNTLNLGTEGIRWGADNGIIAENTLENFSSTGILLISGAAGNRIGGNVIHTAAPGIDTSAAGTTSYTANIESGITGSDAHASTDTYSGSVTSVPGSASASGITGMIAEGSGFIYACISNNTWQRVAIATW